MSLKKFDDFKSDEIKLDNTNVLNESSVDYDLLNKIERLPCFNKLREDFRKAVSEFTKEVELALPCDYDENDECTGFDEGDTDHTMALEASIQSALDAISGY